MKKYKNGFIEEILICECHSDEHVIRWSMDTDPEFPAIYLHIFLNNDFGLPYWIPSILNKPCLFFRRLWTAIKYTFGYKCKYGHWDEFMFNPEDIDTFIEYLNKFKEARKKEGEK